MARELTAVIFTSQRSGLDESGYLHAGHKMDALVRLQPGYLSHVSVRDETGLGITISYWESPEAARDWKAVHEHQDAQRDGYQRWYSWYRVDVTTIQRHYESIESGFPITTLPEES